MLRTARLGRAFARLTLIAAGIWFGPPGLTHAQQGAPEGRLKAAVLSKLPQFVEWPAGALDGRTTLDLCVNGSSAFARDLSELTAGEVLTGRTLLVREVRAASDLQQCHVLYLPSGTGSASLLKVAASLPVLTVGDGPGFLDEGGIVALRTVQGRVRFEVDAGAARRSRLRISSQLLRLALAVRGEA